MDRSLALFPGYAILLQFKENAAFTECIRTAVRVNYPLAHTLATPVLQLDRVPRPPAVNGFAQVGGRFITASKHITFAEQPARSLIYKMDLDELISGEFPGLKPG